MSFDILHLIKETAYQHDKKANWFVNVTLDYERAKDKMYIYNYHYQNYKKSVNKGFDYRIFSDSFIEFKDEHFFIDLLYDVNGAK